MQDIKFSGKNGDCPYFIYDDYKFFIQDSKVGNEWKYSFYMKDLKSDTLTFATDKEALNYIKSIDKIKFVYSSEFQNLQLYETIHKDYILNKNKINIKNKPEFIALDFDSYVECLKFGKKYVSEFIKKHDRQMTIF
jgi:hypothetical protein